jgi:hypothetical protein
MVLVSETKFNNREMNYLIFTNFESGSSRQYIEGCRQITPACLQIFPYSIRHPFAAKIVVTIELKI